MFSVMWVRNNIFSRDRTDASDISSELIYFQIILVSASVGDVNKFKFETNTLNRMTSEIIYRNILITDKSMPGIFDEVLRHNYTKQEKANKKWIIENQVRKSDS